MASQGALCEWSGGAFLQRRLGEWRARHGGRGRRIPQELWDEAAEVGRVEGVAATARLLRLDRARLEERVTRLEGWQRVGGRVSSQFVEVALPALSGSGRTLVRLVSREGDEVCVDLPGVVDVQGLLRAFWGRRCCS